MTVLISTQRLAQPVAPGALQGRVQGYLSNQPKETAATLPDAKPASAATATEITASTKVNLSLAARTKQWGSSALADAQRQMAEDKKAKARERLAEIKERVDQLKRLVALFGSMAPKALLRELQQLTGELKSVAKDLKEGWGANSSGGTVTLTVNDAGMLPDASAGETADVSAEVSPVVSTENNPVVNTEKSPAVNSANSPANSIDETILSPSAEAAMLADPVAEDSNTDAESNDTRHSAERSESAVLSATVMAALQQQTEEAQAKKQRREDQQALEKVRGDLQLLFNLLKAQLRQEDRDKDTEKQLDKISEQFADSGKLAAELTNGSNALDLHINITV